MGNVGGNLKARTPHALPDGPLTDIDLAGYAMVLMLVVGSFFTLFFTSLTKGSVGLLLRPPPPGLQPRDWLSTWALRTHCTVLCLTLTS